MVNNENEIKKIKGVLIGEGYEYYKGQVVQGEEPHFFIKGEKLIRVILDEWADEEIIESIKQLK